jgi:c-di-GMP-binding flagellar brake protein YcgR
MDITNEILKDCCDYNQNLTLSVKEKESVISYRSRFLYFDGKNQQLIIDEASAETPNALPLSRGQKITVFFKHKKYHYLFDSRIIDHTVFKIREAEIHALSIVLPKQLNDGERRDYFRVQTPEKPYIKVEFSLYPGGGSQPVMSNYLNTQAEIYAAEMLDISGGGCSMREMDGSKNIGAQIGDHVLAKFKLRPDIEEMQIWSEVRSKRKYGTTQFMVFGLQFINDLHKNAKMNHYRNKIMRYVIERQREILYK